MIEESYVSLDTAKLLKGAGFDVPCECYYSWFNGKPIKGYCDGKVNHNRDKSEYADISRPTLALAARWLREVHGIHAFAFFDYVNRDWCYCIADLHAVTAEMGMYMSEDNYSTYEEALEEGLKRSFELIKK